MVVLKLESRSNDLEFLKYARHLLNQINGCRQIIILIQ